MKIVQGFRHERGNHCGSTSMRDLLRHVGLDLSEAMCFGLGSGLGFYYFNDLPGVSRFFHGRTATLERDLCRHLGVEFEEGTDDDAEHAWQVARAFIKRDVPMLLNVELSLLPYYNTRTPFPGHRVVLAGYDDARDIAFIADNAFQALQEVPSAALSAARSADIASALFPLRNDWLIVQPTRAPRARVDAVRDALRENARGMLSNAVPFGGIGGMEMLAAEFAGWGDTPDWEFCARFGYQIIERRGTGGSAFRKMYAQFLREAEALDARLGAANLAAAMEEIAVEWSRLAQWLRGISNEKARARFVEAGQAMRRLAVREREFWERVRTLVDPSGD